jgi:hypothetical protein
VPKSRRSLQPMYARKAPLITSSPLPSRSNLSSACSTPHGSSCTSR